MKFLDRRNFVKSVCAGCVLLGLKESRAGNLHESPQYRLQKRPRDNKLCNSVEILFLGTGAADWPVGKYPSDVNELLKGNHRGLSSALINNQILIDCGPTVPKALDIFNVNVDLISDIVITHTHGDHFSLKSFEQLKKRRASKKKINVWLETGAMLKAKKLSGYNVHPLNAIKSFYVPGFEILPLYANHKVEDFPEKPLHYLFKSKNKTFFYSLDGAWLPTQTWREIKKERLDAVIWDATIGQQEGDYRIFEHNSLDMIRYMNRTLRSNGVLSDDTKIILSHMARTLHPHYSELKKCLSSENMTPAHDGMKIKV